MSSLMREKAGIEDDKSLFNYISRIHHHHHHHRAAETAAPRSICYYGNSYYVQNEQNDES